MKTSQKLEKKWKNKIDKLDSKCRESLLQEDYKKLFTLIDNFSGSIKYVEVDVIWLLKFRKISTDSLFKEIILEGFDEYIQFFNFKHELMHCFYYDFPDFENISHGLPHNMHFGRKIVGRVYQL